MPELPPYITAVEAVSYLLWGEFRTMDDFWGRVREQAPKIHSKQELRKLKSRPADRSAADIWDPAAQRLFDAYVRDDIKTLLSHGAPIPKGTFACDRVTLAPGNWLMIGDQIGRKKWDPELGGWSDIKLRRGEFLAWFKKSGRPPAAPACNSPYGAEDAKLMPEITRLMDEQHLPRLTAARQIAAKAKGSDKGDSVARRLERKHKKWVQHG